MKPFHKENGMKKRRKPLWPFMFALAMASGLATVAAADEYQFICTPGWNPVTASLAKSSTTRSLGTAVATGTIRSRTEASALEARYRTIEETDPIALRTDKWMGVILFFR
jgi:hypothetical protein